MPRGNAQQVKVLYKGDSDDFVIFIESLEELENWKKDTSVPLARVMSGWKVFCTHKQGAQGILDEAAKSHLENEFGTSRVEEVVKKILNGGSPQVGTASERQGVTNITAGPTIAH